MEVGHHWFADITHTSSLWSDVLLNECQEKSTFTNQTCTLVSFGASSKGISGPEELLYLLLLATVWVQLVQAVWCLASGGTQGKLKQNSSPLGKTLNVPSLEGRDCSWRKSPSGHRQRMCCITARTANSQQSQTRAITLQLKRNFFPNLDLNSKKTELLLKGFHGICRNGNSSILWKLVCL